MKNYVIIAVAIRLFFPLVFQPNHAHASQHGKIHSTILYLFTLICFCNIGGTIKQYGIEMYFGFTFPPHPGPLLKEREPIYLHKSLLINFSPSLLGEGARG